MALVSANQFQTVPELSRLGTGFQQGQQIRSGIDARQLAQQQQETQAARQAQLGGLQQQVLAGQQPQVTPPLGGAGALLPVDQQRGQQQSQGIQAKAQLAVQFPEEFDAINKNLGLISQQQKDEAADFAFDLKSTPFDQREGKIQARSQSLASQNRNGADTSSLSGLSEADQNDALDSVQVAALSPEKRLDLAQGGGKGLASAKTEITADGTVIQALPGGDVQVRNPAGEIVTGQARLDALKASQDFKIESQQQQADIEVNKARDIATVKARAGRTSAIRKDQTERRQIASRGKLQLDEALKLTESATQGAAGQVKLLAAKVFPNIDVSSEAALGSAMTSLAVDQLQRMKGPSTDFEFAKMEDISGSIADPKTANIAKIKVAQRAGWFVNREAEQFNKFIADNGDPDLFAFDFNETVKTKKGPISLQDLRETAAHNNLSMEETIKRFNK